ncbi:MAG: hypothetical protein KGI67_15470, partial [Pseudomonadota bacterium]|nr:hypothetical protein [Pseudomonadota bacterium]
QFSTERQIALARALIDLARHSLQARPASAVPPIDLQRQFTTPAFGQGSPIGRLGRRLFRKKPGWRA